MKNVNFALIPGKIVSEKRQVFVLLALILLMLLCLSYFTGKNLPVKEWFFKIDTDERSPAVQTVKIGEIEEVSAVQRPEEIVKGPEKIPEKGHVASIKGQIDINPEGVEEGKDAEKDSIAEQTEQIEVKEATGEKGDQWNQDYCLQFCSCVIKDNSEKIYDRLKQKGYNPVIMEDSGQIRMHNIYSEIFSKEKEAVSLFNRLKSNGFDPGLMTLSDGRHTLRISSCYYRKSVRRILARLNGFGFKARALDEVTRTRMYSVLLGGFKTFKEAKETRQRFVDEGFTPIVVTKKSLSNS